MPDVFSNILQKEQISWCGSIMQTFSLIRQRNPSSFFYFLVLIAEAKTQSACHTFEFKNIPHNTNVVWQPTTSPHIKKTKSYVETKITIHLVLYFSPHFL